MLIGFSEIEFFVRVQEGIVLFCKVIDILKNIKNEFLVSVRSYIILLI